MNERERRQSGYREGHKEPDMLPATRIKATREPLHDDLDASTAPSDNDAHGQRMQECTDGYSADRELQ